jgi:coenzyme F420-reducing hydrogenase beta subunit
VNRSKKTIQLASPLDCTACTACVSICPAHCISISENQVGFSHADINQDVCLNCHKCEKVCPILNSHNNFNKQKCKVFAAIHKDNDVLLKSSSGGVFYAISKYVFKKKGVVFGAACDDIHLSHQHIETIDDILPLMGSKYIQSNVSGTFEEVKSFLENNRWVLFAGTPCQVAGLKAFLRKDYETLITVDLICHGVTSSIVWEKYISRLKRTIGALKIKNLTFRKKHMSINLKNALNFNLSFDYMDNNGIWYPFNEYWSKNEYFSYFMRHIFMSSCYNCKFRSVYASMADFTIGDCWNAHLNHPNLPKGYGISSVICHTNKATNVFNSIKSEFMIEEEDVSIMENRYASARLEASEDKSKRLWILSNQLAAYIPLKWLRIIYMHDRLDFIIQRKLQKVWKRNTK